MLPFYRNEIAWFRNEHFWKEQVDKVISVYLPVLQNVFGNFSGTAPNLPKKHQLNEFKVSL